MSEATNTANWANTNIVENYPNSAVSLFLSTGSVTVTVTYADFPPIGMAINVLMDPAPTDPSTRLYLVSDANAHGETLNAIETYYVDSPADRFLSYDDSDSGMRYLVGIARYMDQAPPDSTAAASVPCIFGKLSGCPTTGPAEGTYYLGDQAASNMAVGAEWTYTASPTPSLFWAAFAAPIPPAEEEPTEELPAVPAQQCLNTTDMAISPERIEIAPGGSTTVNLTVRNTDTVPQGYHDVVLSLSDGLSVSGVSEGMRNLGQRAALEQLILQPNETRSVAVTVTAADSLPTAPVHVAELYCGGRVVSRIDGVFVPVAAAGAASPAPVVAVEPAPTAAPAPLPAVLPNTAGEQVPALVPFVIWPALIAVLALLLRRRRA